MGHKSAILNRPPVLIFFGLFPAIERFAIHQWLEAVLCIGRKT
jgi:hypothetical protein